MKRKVIEAISREPSSLYKEQVHANLHFDIGPGAGYNASTQPYYIAAMRHLFDAIKPGRLSFSDRIFLDLGSGTGTLVIYAAHHGLLGLGIEADKDLFDRSGNTIEEVIAKSFIKPGRAKVAHGNFFPEGFYVERSTEMEDKWINHLPNQDDPNSDPYSQLEINLNEVDMFYHYQVERRQNILNLVSTYAKSGAMLVFLPTLPDSFEVPRNIETVKEFRRLTLYKKL